MSTVSLTFRLKCTMRLLEMHDADLPCSANHMYRANRRHYHASVEVASPLGS
jgi:hypothetical protein